MARHWQVIEHPLFLFGNRFVIPLFTLSPSLLSSPHQRGMYSRFTGHQVHLQCVFSLCTFLLLFDDTMHFVFSMFIKGLIVPPWPSNRNRIEILPHSMMKSDNTLTSVMSAHLMLLHALRVGLCTRSFLFDFLCFITDIFV
jgi:hypothetical protein